MKAVVQLSKSAQVKQAVLKKIRFSDDINRIQGNLKTYQQRFGKSDAEIPAAAVESSLKFDIGYAILVCEDMRNDYLTTGNKGVREWTSAIQRSHIQIITKHSLLGNLKGVLYTWKKLISVIPESQLSSLTFSSYISALVVTQHTSYALTYYHSCKKRSWKVTHSSTNALLQFFPLEEAYDYVKKMFDSTYLKKDPAALIGLLRCASRKGFMEAKKAMVYVKEKLQTPLTGTHWNILLEAALRFEPPQANIIQTQRLENDVPLTASTYVLLISDNRNSSDAYDIYVKAVQDFHRNPFLREAILQVLSKSRDPKRGEISHQIITTAPFVTPKMMLHYRRAIYDVAQDIDFDEYCVV